MKKKSNDFNTNCKSHEILKSLESTVNKTKIIKTRYKKTTKERRITTNWFSAREIQWKDQAKQNERSAKIYL